TKSRVAEGLAEMMAGHPEGDDTLVGLPELSRSGQDPAPVDDGAQAVGIGVLLDQKFGGKLGRAVERTWKVGGERLGHASRGDTRLALTGSDLEPCGGLDGADLPQGRDGVDPRRGEEDEVPAARARELQAIRSSVEVRLQDVGGGARA